jgi:hypothetical protein
MIPEARNDGAPDASPALVCVPLLPRDVVRGALVWNLAVELARQGASTCLLAPPAATCSSWPPPGPGPLGLEIVEVAAADLASFARAAEAAARRTTKRAAGSVLALATVPAGWLREATPPGPLARWVLLLARPDEHDLLETWSALEAVATRAPRARLGTTVFGVRTLADARHTFEGLATLAELELSRRLVSYGALIDDVHLSRSIVTRRPIPLAQPGSSAARALADVASMLIEDAPGASGGAEAPEHEAAPAAGAARDREPRQDSGAG